MGVVRGSIPRESIFFVNFPVSSILSNCGKYLVDLFLYLHFSYTNGTYAPVLISNLQQVQPWHGAVCLELPNSISHQ